MNKTDLTNILKGVTVSNVETNNSITRTMKVEPIPMENFSVEVIRAYELLKEQHQVYFKIEAFNSWVFGNHFTRSNIGRPDHSIQLINPTLKCDIGNIVLRVTTQIDNTTYAIKEVFKLWQGTGDNVKRKVYSEFLRIATIHLNSRLYPKYAFDTCRWFYYYTSTAGNPYNIEVYQRNPKMKFYLELKDQHRQWLIKYLDYIGCPTYIE